MTNQYNCVLSPYINIKYDFSYLSTEIKKSIIILSKWFPYPPFLCPIVGIISQCFSVCSIGKLKWKFFFKLQPFLKKFSLANCFAENYPFYHIFISNFELILIIWYEAVYMYIQIHVSICVHACRFILRIVYHIRYIVNYKQNRVFSINTLTKHLHVIARENNVSVLVPII